MYTQYGTAGTRGLGTGDWDWDWDWGAEESSTRADTFVASL